MSRILWLIAVISFLFSSLAMGQVVHDVMVGPMGLPEFDPPDIVINVGDTVRWSWIDPDPRLLGHNVESSDLFFISGPPVCPPHIFEWVFDQTFVENFPVAGNFYTYHCIVHFPIMAGSVQVEVPPDDFVRGDCNADAAINIADAVFVLNQLFGTPPPIRTCDDSCDSNGDRMKNIADAIYLLNFLFSMGPPPPPPWPDCGADDNPNSLGCAEFPPCGP